MLLLLTPIIAFGSIESADSIFQKAIAAHGKPHRGEIVVVATEKSRVATTHAKFRISIPSKSKSAIEIWEHPSAKNGRNHRMYFVNGNVFTAYDFVAHERISRTSAVEVSGIERLEYFIGNLNPLVRCVASSVAARAAIDNFRNFGKWSVSNEGSLLVVRSFGQGSKSKSAVVWRFDRRSYRLRGLELINSSGNAKYTYADTNNSVMATFTIPDSARKVRIFTEQPLEPVFKSSAAANYYRKSVDALFRLSNTSIRHSDGSIAYVGKSEYGEKTASSMWTFGGGIFKLDVNRKPVVRQKADSSKVINSLAARGIVISPDLRALIQRKNPMHAYAPSGSQVRLVGSMVLRDNECAILRASSGPIENTIWIDKKSYLPVQVESVTTPPGQREKIRNTATFAYAKIAAIPKLSD